MSSPLEEVVRREYPGGGTDIYLNAASWGLVPESAAREAADFTLRRNAPRGVDVAEFGGIQRRARGAVADLLGVDRREVALVPNTSFGVNLAASLVGEGPPGTVVLSEGEFPANVFPWKMLEGRGFQVEIVPADAWGRPREDALVKALDGPDVRALAVSSVQFATGYLCDLARLGDACASRDVLFCVDAIQSVGAVPLRPRAANIDVLACGAQKWLCSPFGSGFAWVRGELVERFRPPMVSWLAMEGSTRLEDMLHYEMAWRGDGRKFELATLGVQDYLAMARSIEVLLEIGIPEVRAYLHTLHQPVLQWLEGRDDARAVTPEDPSRRAGILSITHPRLEAAAAALEAEGVILSVREGALRLAPHVYNTVQEMERVVAILEREGRPKPSPGGSAPLGSRP